MQNFLVGDRSYVGQRLETGSRGLDRNNQLDNGQNLASIHWHFVDDRACKKRNNLRLGQWSCRPIISVYGRSNESKISFGDSN